MEILRGGRAKNEIEREEAEKALLAFLTKLARKFTPEEMSQFVYIIDADIRFRNDAFMDYVKLRMWGELIRRDFTSVFPANRRFQPNLAERLIKVAELDPDRLRTLARMDEPGEQPLQHLGRMLYRFGNFFLFLCMSIMWHMVMYDPNFSFLVWRDRVPRISIQLFNPPFSTDHLASIDVPEREDFALYFAQTGASRRVLGIENPVPTIWCTRDYEWNIPVDDPTVVHPSRKLGGRAIFAVENDDHRQGRLSHERILIRHNSERLRLTLQKDVPPTRASEIEIQPWTRDDADGVFPTQDELSIRFVKYPDRFRISQTSRGYEPEKIVWRPSDEDEPRILMACTCKHEFTFKEKRPVRNFFEFLMFFNDDFNVRLEAMDPVQFVSWLAHGPWHRAVYNLNEEEEFEITTPFDAVLTFIANDFHIFDFSTRDAVEPITNSLQIRGMPSKGRNSVATWMRKPYNPFLGILCYLLQEQDPSQRDAELVAAAILFWKEEQLRDVGRNKAAPGQWPLWRGAAHCDEPMMIPED